MRGPLVYWLYDANQELIYVGATKRLLSERLTWHRGERVWWDEAALVSFQSCPLHELAAIEAAAIRTGQPRYNRQAGRYPKHAAPANPVRFGHSATDRLAKGPVPLAEFLVLFTADIDPDGTMPVREKQVRLRRATAAWHAHVSLRRMKVRRAREAREAATKESAA